MANVSNERKAPVPFDIVNGVEIEPAGDLLYEVVDGRIVEKLLDSRELWLANELSTYLGETVRPNRLGRVFVEMIFLLDENRNQRRRPDVSFVSMAKWISARPISRSRAAWPIVPDLAIEVISPLNKTEDDIAKVVEYFHYGVRKVWLVLPDLRQIYAYSSPTDVRILSSENADVLDGEDVIPGFRLPLTTLFEDALTDEAAE